ncbi:MAG TPA: hypothetical protein VFH73_28670 [Polyangia bacterium]|jgi:hypothetical protein|nr:hypothetical protein [Polyangia bacterium]
MRILAALFGLSVLIAGCGTFVTDTPINPPPRPVSPRGYGSVAVFSSAPPTRSHVDVALIEVEQTHDLNTQGTDLMIQRLRERAGALGCDAVVIGGMRERGRDVHGFDSGSTTLHATCIVYDDRR